MPCCQNVTLKMHSVSCVHPSDYSYLGFTWNNLYYYDRCLAMGASSYCQIFERFSCVLQWMMDHKYHIIDDFLFVDP